MAMANFQSCYDILEHQAKSCLMCLSIFPEKSIIKKRFLIYWWIGEGYVTRTSDNTAEEVEEIIFEELIKDRMINPVHNNRGKLLVDASLSRGAILLVNAEQKEIPIEVHIVWQSLATHHIEVEDGKFLKGLEAQENLEYLSLRGISRITELPASIGKLTNPRPQSMQQFIEDYSL
ncbi:hypothetical protein GIB67_001762 [Kingdonia uniflora]|uniref:Disease resistance protein winged helix domain-containing protein n=1 Tax=Kingdonia uniflora TaxID=39325 RepID=A0A7J7LBH2_9MAGN|nr:hypothetical protein GIB67_001762 [Kingdonia uniflora]